VKEIEVLAKRLLAEIAAVWRSEPNAFITTADGVVMLVCTIRGVSGATIIYYNPLPAVEKMIESAYQLAAELADEVEHTEFVEQNVRDSIRSLLSIAPLHFKDSLDELRLKAETFKTCHILAGLGDRKKRDEVLNIMLDAFNQKTRRRFRVEVKPGKRSKGGRAITDFWVSTAIMVIDKSDKDASVEMEAARQLAELMGSTPTAAKAALRKWYQRKGYNTWPVALEVVRAELKAREDAHARLDIPLNMKQVDED
jgi:hypothetical protein